MTTPSARSPGLSPLEVASEIILGQVGAETPDQPLADVSPKPAADALADAIRPALERPPCLVAFSGGRDSSAILAVATRLAREEGHALPIPATMRFPDDASAEETDWQELVISHLDLPEWHRREIREELHLLGPLAKSVLRRHGLLWPSNAFQLRPLLEEASGGSLLTGTDGDGLFDEWQWARLWSVLRRRERPERADALRAAKMAAPVSVGARVNRARYRSDFELSWLHPEPRADLTAQWATDVAHEPKRWLQRVRWWGRRRYVAMVTKSLGLLAEDAGTHLDHPLMNAGFLEAVGRAGGVSGFRDRTAAMRALFADVLPDATLARTSKAMITASTWDPTLRDFADSWDGSGVPDLVDTERLRERWLDDDPDARTGLLLQAAWLSAERGA